MTYSQPRPSNRPPGSSPPPPSQRPPRSPFSDSPSPHEASAQTRIASSPASQVEARAVSVQPDPVPMRRVIPVPARHLLEDEAFLKKGGAVFLYLSSGIAAAIPVFAVVTIALRLIPIPTGIVQTAWVIVSMAALQWKGTAKLSYEDSLLPFPFCIGFILPVFVLSGAYWNG